MRISVSLICRSPTISEVEIRWFNSKPEPVGIPGSQVERGRSIEWYLVLEAVVSLATFSRNFDPLRLELIDGDGSVLGIGTVIKALDKHELIEITLLHPLQSLLVLRVVEPLIIA